LALLICFLSQSIGLFILLVDNGGVFIIFFLLFFGFGMGPFVSLHAQWVLQLYGVEKFQQAYATIRIASILGAATGPVVAGLIFDMAQSYLGAFLMVILFYFVGVFVLTKKISLGSSVPSSD
jgi:MFS family permease